MPKPTYKELQARIKELDQQVNELKHLVNLKVYPQDLHFETKDLLYFRIGKDWCFEFVDRRISDLTGYDSEILLTKKLSWLDILHEEDREGAKNAVEIACKRDKFYQAEFRIVKKSGDIAWVKMRGPILCEDNGDLLAIQGILDDITDLKNMEKAIESEHEVFAWVADSMDDGMYIIDSNYRIRFMNKALIDILGNHVGEICYKALFNRDSVCPWSVMDTIKLEVCGFQEYHLTDVGKTFQVRSFPIRNPDGTIGKLGQLRDVTKTRKMQGEIEDYALQHQAIIDAANIADLGIFILQNHDSVEARFSYANDAFCRISGYSSQELLGKGFIDFVHQDSVPKVLDRYRRRRNGEEIPHSYEFKMVRKDGATISVNISACLSTYGGEISTVGFLQDFTAKKKFQKSLWLSQRLASIGRLAAEVAHEINNPLTSILTFIKLVDKILNHEPFPLERLGELREFLSFMNSEATRCAGIARNLLDFARHGDIDLKDNDIHEILDRTLDVLRHRAEMNGIKIETHYDRNVPHLFCDFKRLQQAFMNMFWNGMEAMASGGVLRVSTQFNEQQELIELVISDTGSGIPEADIENIFEPFYTTKSDGKGVGLGLSVSYGIIRRHHGQVRVQSECGKGTTFMIQFRLTGNQSREIANGEDLEDEIDQQEVVAGAPHEA